MLPILFSLGPLEVHTAAILLSLGFIIGGAIFLKRVSVNRLNFSVLADYMLFLLLGTLTLSRMTYLLFNWSAYEFNHAEHTILGILAIWDSGFSFWGGILGFLIALTFVVQKNRDNIWEWLDIVSMPLLLIIFFSHLGAFFEGTRYGHESGLPWSVLFEGGSVKYTVPVHPTQLYAALYTLGLLFMLKFFRPAFISHKIKGSVFLGTLFAYAVLTFLEGFLRGDDIFMVSFIRIDQLLSVTFAALAFALLRKKLKHEHY